MLTFIIGFIIGGVVGTALMAIMAAKWHDDNDKS